MTNAYYGAHAYRSDAIPNQAKAERSILYRIGKIVLPWGNTQEVFYPNVSPQILRNTERRKQEEKLTGKVFDESQFHYRYDHEIYRFAKASLWTRILFLAKDFGFVGTIGMGSMSLPIYLIAIFAANKSFMEVTLGTLSFIVWAVGVPFVLWILTAGIIRFAPVYFWLRPSKGASWELNRRTGMVKIFKNNFTAPFYEWDAYLSMTADKQGFNTYSLHLVHRYTKKHFNAMGPIPISHDEQLCFCQWDFLQNFMDVTRPLPDAPDWEATRHLDPVTAEHDKQTNRNPRYWIDMDDQTWQQVKRQMELKIYTLATTSRSDIMKRHLVY